MEQRFMFSIKYRDKIYNLISDKNKLSPQDILEFLELSKEYAFVVKNGEIVLLNTSISPEDEIEVINAVSGG